MRPGDLHIAETNIWRKISGTVARPLAKTATLRTPSLDLSFETVLALLRGVSNFYAIDEQAGKNEDSDREAKQTQDGEHGWYRLGNHRENRQGSLGR